MSRLVPLSKAEKDEGEALLENLSQSEMPLKFTFCFPVAQRKKAWRWEYIIVMLKQLSDGVLVHHSFFIIVRLLQHFALS